MKINYKGIEIEFQLSYRKRKTLKISVKPDCTVEVTAPLGINKEDVKKIILKKAVWILNRKKYFKENPPKIESINYEYSKGAKHFRFF